MGNPPISIITEKSMASLMLHCGTGGHATMERMKFRLSSSVLLIDHANEKEMPQYLQIDAVELYNLKDGTLTGSLLGGKKGGTPGTDTRQSIGEVSKCSECFRKLVLSNYSQFRAWFSEKPGWVSCRDICFAMDGLPPSYVGYPTQMTQMLLIHMQRHWEIPPLCRLVLYLGRAAAR